MDERNRTEGPKQNYSEPAHGDEELTQRTPSQAEGDRDTVEADIARKFGEAKPNEDEGRERYQTGGGGQGDVVHTPSQAEGEEKDVEE